MLLGQKVSNLRVIIIEDFIFGEHHDFETNWSSSENPRQYFFLSIKYCMPTACPASEVIARH